MIIVNIFGGRLLLFGGREGRRIFEVYGWMDDSRIHVRTLVRTGFQTNTVSVLRVGVGDALTLFHH